MPSTQIVQHSGGKAVVPRSSPPQTFLLPFGKNLYTVPATAIKSYPKFPNEMPSGENLGALLATKAPEKWFKYCKPDTLCRIEGDTGNCVYTTFDVPGWPDEKRFLRLISATVASKNFEQVKKDNADVEITKKHQQVRMEVLNWTKDTDCPGRAQINPEIEKWDVVTGTDMIKSCFKAPEAKKRVKPGTVPDDGMESKRKKYICSEELLQVPPGSTYKINELGGLLHVLFYRTAATTATATAATTATAVEDDEDDL
jgi:hypothetical protein|tara:strand:+ start:2093 stop:2860 length:768 start_codon:yes stop_codon:yes gene_type:complete